MLPPKCSSGSTDADDMDLLEEYRNWNANPNVDDLKKFQNGDFLFLASKLLSPRMITNLLQDGASVLIQNVEQKTALDFVCEHNCGKEICKGNKRICTEKLVEGFVNSSVKSEEDVKYFLRSLQKLIYATDGIYTQRAAEMILNNQYCWKVFTKKLKENDLIGEALLNGQSLYPICEIIRKFPTATIIIKNQLDHCISQESSMNPHFAESNITLDFSCFLPYQKISNTETTVENGEKRNGPLEPEMGFLNEMIDTKTTEVLNETILKHPLVTAYVKLKWKRFRPFAILSVLFYILLSVLMSAYVINIQLATCRIKLNYDALNQENYTTRNTANNRTFGTLFTLLLFPPPLEKHNKEKSLCREFGGTFSKIFIPAIFLMILIVLVLEILEIWTERSKYCKGFGNYLQWIYILFGTLTLFPVNMVPARIVLYVQYQLAAFGILTIWSLLLIQASKFELLARYVDMLGQVLKSFLGFIVAFSCLFIGFTMCNLMIFSNFEATETVFRSALKTLITMNGEFSYEEKFYRDIRDVKAELPLGLKNKHILLYPVSSHLFLAISVIVCSMALMNMLIALAVQDVGIMLKHAEKKMLKRMIKEIFHTEKVIFHIIKILPPRAAEWLQRKIVLDLGSEVHRPDGSILKRDGGAFETKMEIFPNSPTENRMSRKTMDAIVRHVIKNLKILDKNDVQGPPEASMIPLHNPDKCIICSDEQDEQDEPMPGCTIM